MIALHPMYVFFSFALLPRFVRRATSPLLFAIPHFRTSTFRNSFYLSAIYFWHSLPDPVRSSPAIGILKGRLFEHLFGLGNDSTAPGSLWVSVVVPIARGPFTRSCSHQFLQYASRSLYYLVLLLLLVGPVSRLLIFIIFYYWTFSVPRYYYCFIS